MRRLGLYIFLALFAIAAWITYDYYKKIYANSIQLDQDEMFIYVPTASTLSTLTAKLVEEGVLVDTASFFWVADKKSFTKPIAGRYLLKREMSNNELVNLLRSGMQEPVKVTVSSARELSKIAGKVARQLELDSIELYEALRSPELANQYGFSTLNFQTMIIPNTYEFYWNTDAESFLMRMANEYKRFWNEERKAKAKKIGLSQSEVTILASIVQEEQQEHPEERARVAGLYLNRLKKGMRLQSDPTLIFAFGDYSIKRVLNVHKEIESPYNTYKYAGLPPGPINIPQMSSIVAVLNAEKHNYLYMCAKADFSGFHEFSTSLSQHNRYAEAYRRELNRRRIMH